MDISALSLQLLGSTTGRVAEPAREEDVARFDALMAVPPTAPAGPAQQFLAGLDGLRDQFSAGMHAVSQVDSPTLHFQYSMLSMGFQFDLLGKLASKLQQDVDQLVKMQ